MAEIVVAFCRASLMPSAGTTFDKTQLLLRRFQAHAGVLGNAAQSSPIELRVTT